MPKSMMKQIHRRLSTYAHKYVINLGVDNRQIIQGFVTVSFFVFLGKLAGAAKEIAVAWRYGISNVVDAYIFTFSLAIWPVNIIGGVIAAVLIPAIADIRRYASNEIPVFRAQLLGAVILLGIAVGAASWLLLPLLMRQPWIGLTGSQSSLASEMAIYLPWIAPMALLSSLLAAWTMLNRRHINTLFEGFPALCILFCVLISGGIWPLILGTLIGYLLQVLSLSVVLARQGELERPSFNFQSPHWQLIFVGLGLMLLSQFLQSLVSLSDQFFAAQLESGTLAALGYSNRILALILGLAATAIARSILPVFSRIHAEGGNVKRLSVRWAGAAFLIGLVTIIPVIFLSEEIVNLLFARGEFTRQDTLVVSEALRFAMVQVPVYLSSTILVYTLLSQGRRKMVLIFSGCGLVMKIFLSFILTPIFGLGGLYLSTAGVFALSSLLSIIVFVKDP